MRITHAIDRDPQTDIPTLEIRRGHGGYMLSVALSGTRSKLTGPYPIAFLAEKAGVAIAAELGVEDLFVVCQWLLPRSDQWPVR